MNVLYSEKYNSRTKTKVSPQRKLHALAEMVPAEAIPMHYLRSVKLSLYVPYDQPPPRQYLSVEESVPKK